MDASTASVILSSLESCDSASLLNALPWDVREDIPMPSLPGAVFTLGTVGTFNVWAGPSGSVEVHRHDSAETAMACHAMNVERAREMIASINVPALIAEARGMMTDAAPTGMYV